MYEGVLRQVRQLIRDRRYVMTLHAEEEMDEDGLTVFDIERGILTGSVVERQKDRSTGERKYVLKGRTLAGDEVVVVTKLGSTGRLVIITVYLV